MKADGQTFLKHLAKYPPNTFERRFARRLRRLRLDNTLDRNALALLYTATFQATLCHIAFNGLGGCQGKIKPERESCRTGLERDFMRARSAFHASRAYHALPKSKAEQIERAFLTVLVQDSNLA